MRSTSKLYEWGLAESASEEVVAKIQSLPAHLRPWVGRIIWWDRYAERTSPVEGFSGWLQERQTPEPNAGELAQALVGFGYNPDFAGMRAGAQQWGIAQKKVGRPAKDNRHAPDGTEFPMRLHPGVSMLMRRIPDRNMIPCYTVSVAFPQTATRRRPPMRKGFSDYFEAMDYALDAVRRLGEDWP